MHGVDGGIRGGRPEPAGIVRDVSGGEVALKPLDDATVGHGQSRNERTWPSMAVAGSGSTRKARADKDAATGPGVEAVQVRAAGRVLRGVDDPQARARSSLPRCVPGPFVARSLGPCRVRTDAIVRLLLLPLFRCRVVRMLRIGEDLPLGLRVDGLFDWVSGRLCSPNSTSRTCSEASGMGTPPVCAPTRQVDREKLTDVPGDPASDVHQSGVGVDRGTVGAQERDHLVDRHRRCRSPWRGSRRIPLPLVDVPGCRRPSWASRAITSSTTPGSACTAASPCCEMVVRSTKRV